MICLTSKPSQKISEIIGISLWLPWSPDLNLFDYILWGIFENNTNANSHPNIGLLKTAIEEEWNKMKNLFLRHVNRFEGVLVPQLKKKNGGPIE